MMNKIFGWSVKEIMNSFYTVLQVLKGTEQPKTLQLGEHIGKEDGEK